MFLGKPIKTLEKMLSVARRARKRIAKERNWVQGKLAVTAKGIECPPRSRKATAFCAVGSLHASTGDERIVRAIENLMLDVVDDSYYDDKEVSELRVLNYFNDDHASHRAVLQVYDEAIERLESRLRWERKKQRGAGHAKA